ncbi:MBL fold metallo-hydrolase [Methylobacillus gramineus]|uniref:MBL fold metallo-hydrolase n=1 Tax=Methylobacillus gramineus TaxID=755169 RepID=UPI001CFFD020|nr:MBL fold metallo-hydrolase [Methylobacillus gramineus]MCB5184054.1 MBL fold metallo-hydrolase [Methylobacillus gramineus]
MQFKYPMLLAGIFMTSLISLNATAAPPLKLEVFNPGEHSVFPVSSELISGKRDIVLIDAQFQRNDAKTLVEKIRRSGKHLTTIYISHSDPDYYFGLDVLHAAFPQAKILATTQTVAAIKASSPGKLAYWGPQLGKNAPQSLVIPEALHDDHLTLEGQSLQIKGLDGPAPDRSYVWIPSLKAIVGGVVISSGIHVWIADTQTTTSRQYWLAALDEIAALKPATIIPGHYLGKAPPGLDALHFTQQYLHTFELAVSNSANSAELIQTMQQQYPGLEEPSALELGAKVVKGEMKWPAE